jgi:pyruvate dehydrogenase E2 component (dihydrolipoyllysine-residue acetyltransferase)
MWWRGRPAALTCGLLVLLAVACGRATDRPLRGAAPGTEAPATLGLPPTLSPSDALRFRPLPPSPSPAPAAAAAVAPSPGASPSPSAVPMPPIVRTIAPSANSNVPPGAVTISAVLVGRGADLASASLALNGADTGAQIDKRSAREWTIRSSRPLGAGSYTARVLVRDESGANGGFTWMFQVGEPEPEEAPAPKPEAKPAAKPEPKPAATPAPTPRRN